MATLAQAFQTFLQNLELTEAERANASNQQRYLRQKIDLHLGGVERDFLSGSYARRTAIRPLNDIDIFLVLDRRHHGDVDMRTAPESCLQKLSRALVAAYTNKDKPTIQGRSVHIEFTGTGIGYDVVPAFVVSGDMYMIPDRNRRSWINTNPEVHKQSLVNANARAGGKLNPLVKAAKRWNRQQGEPMRSFHLEVLACSAFSTPPASYLEGLRALFEYLAGAVQGRCPEPAGVGPNVDEGMTSEERGRSTTMLRHAAEVVLYALSMDARGFTEEAHFVLRELLGPEYPERGRRPAGR
ncbi:CBASS oligonucleotide cyclase [Polyangium mundeleinium]|uniref:CBASS oligonucleotide cyclase n=1 Tax=Polyangium mundeleinium TaxID=2995306 RepID=A0ABT5EST3_9BACT|nr:CBASS oligonucleotide cyclase [Polyangium mundeleinium]MDC0744816.1 CBASS oligonucleotide cyclase [Polyangium mundeleinium]